MRDRVRTAARWLVGRGQGDQAFLVRVWLAGAALVLVFVARFWIAAGVTDPRHAETPIDRANAAVASRWSFLAAAALEVPAGASYTVRAHDPGEEMEVYMLSMGLLRHALPLPSSYYGRPLDEVAHGADYVLVYGDGVSLRAGLIPVTRFPGGWVYRLRGELP